MLILAVVLCELILDKNLILGLRCLLSCLYIVSKLFCLVAQEEEHIPSLLTIHDINASMADVALELATRKYSVLAFSQ